jgi:molybdopterin synthase sulfur carrier subunit
MPVRVRVPTPLRRFTAGNGEVVAAGASIKDVINDLESRHPGMRDRLLDDKGEISNIIDDAGGATSINPRVTPRLTTFP